MAKMRRWLVSVSAALVAAASATAVVPAPPAGAGDAPIGHIGTRCAWTTARSSRT